MFAPKVGKPAIGAAVNLSSGPARPRFGLTARRLGSVEQALLLHRNRSGADHDPGAVSVGRTDDPLEREADLIASRVVRGEPAHFLRAANGALPHGDPPSSGRPAMELPVRPWMVPLAPGSSTAGQPLPASVRAAYEPLFGMDLSGVRIHTDMTAARVARATGARAFAVGSDIGFALNEYAPETSAGGRLLAHELAHVAQASMVPGHVLRRQPQAAGSGGGIQRLLVGEGGLDILGQAVLGEFAEDPSLAAIALDTGVTLIPGVDQVGDARDLTAHIYYLVARGEYNSPMRWVGLVLTAIGAIPEVGTAIKGVARLLMRAVVGLAEHAGEIVRALRRLLPQVGDNLPAIVRWFRANWPAWRAAARISAVAAINRVTDAISYVSSSARRVRDMAGAQIDAALAQVMRQLDDAFERLLRAVGIDEIPFGPQLVPAQGPPISQSSRLTSTGGATNPAPAGPLRATSSGSGGGSHAARQYESDKAFSDLAQELGTSPPSPPARASQGQQVRDSFQQAVDAGFIRSNGSPGSVDLGIQPHALAPDQRAVAGLTGATTQSAHIGATSLLRTLQSYSRRVALTANLPIAVHRAFDAHWLRWISQRRAQISATGSADFRVPIQEVLDAQRAAIRQIPGLSDRTRGALEWQLQLEIDQLVQPLSGGRNTLVPLPNVKRR